MVVSDDVLAVLNKVAYNRNLPLKVIVKIYEEQIHYMEFMFSQVNIYEVPSHINVKIPHICNFYILIQKLYTARMKYSDKPEWYDKHIKNETLRIDRLLKSHPNHVKFIKSLRRKRINKWGYLSDKAIQRNLEQRLRKRKKTGKR